MNSTGAPSGWTDEQWNRIQQAVHDEARKARVAGRFLPLFGPLPGDVATVPAHLIEVRTNRHAPSESTVNKRLAIDDTEVLPLLTVAVNVFLTATQQADPDLSSALTLFMRAASMIARIEDAIIFRGADWTTSVQSLISATDVAPINEVVDVSPSSGLTNLRTLLKPSRNELQPLTVEVDNAQKRGQGLVELVDRGISQLDARGFQGPCALVLSQNLFIDAETPNANSLVLPSDRIKPLLDGPLLRSTVIPENEGVLVSLAGNPIEIVVASDIRVRFLQLTTDPLHVYRVSEKFVLRIKQSAAVLGVKLLDKGNASNYKTEAAKARAAAEAHDKQAETASKTAEHHRTKAADARSEEKAYKAKAKDGE